MTKRHFPYLQTALSILCLFVLNSCEDPAQKAREITPPALEEKPEVAPPAVETGQTGAEAVVEVEEKQENQPGYPYFHIYRDGETLVVDGVLKSIGQVKQINSELERYFPELSLESGLRKDPLRHAVGWGNRVSDAVLFDYFTMVTEPEIEYKEGIITLRGSLEDSRDHRKITEMVIAGFSDVWTNDLVNEIKVGN